MTQTLQKLSRWFCGTLTWVMDKWNQRQQSQLLARLHDQVQYHFVSQNTVVGWLRGWRSDVQPGVSSTLPSFVVRGGRVVSAPATKRRKVSVVRTTLVVTAVVIDPVHHKNIDVTRALLAYMTFDDNFLTVAELIPWLLYVHNQSSGITHLCSLLVADEEGNIRLLKSHHVV